MTYVFGPVPSRRLGRSLGVDMVPMKTCTLSCRYCQIGETPRTTIERKSWVPIDEVLSELQERLGLDHNIDWITFSGSGEPTLNSDIGIAIDAVKKMSDVPVCVITNGTLLWMPEVREALLHADVVMPSLDSAVTDTFNRICLPHPDITVERIISGLEMFRDRYSGTMWLEILFVKGLNDTEQEIDALEKAIGRIRPDVVHLNTVVRPPAESGTEPVSLQALESIRARIGEKAEIIASFGKDITGTNTIDEKSVIEYLKRRPGSTKAIAEALDGHPDQVLGILTRLAEQHIIQAVSHFGKEFWEYLHRTPAP